MRRNRTAFGNLSRVVVICIAFGITATTQAAELYGLTGRGGTPKATLHVIDQTDASVTPVLQLNDNNGGQVIAYNPDDGHLYHWTGWPASNARFERINLETLTVTDIPLSGFATNEIYSATYDPLTGVFLTSDLSRNLATVTIGGVRTYVGTTDNWVRGLTFYGDALLGGHNSLIPVDTLWEIDPTNGEFLTTTHVTVPGYTMASFSSMATNPDTGELWAVVMVAELRRKDRLLVKLDPATGDTTLVGAFPVGSGFSSIAFVPDPVTFESTAEDIADGLAAELIANFGIANSLLAKLEAAAAAAERGQPATAIRILKAFAREVEAQAGKRLSPEIADVLLNDAAALIDSLAGEL